MWRSIGLGLMAAMALLVACGGGGDSSARSQPCPLDRTHTPIGSQVLPRVSLDEARKRAQFELAVPGELPPGVTVSGVLLYLDPNCPDKRVRIADIYFSGGGYYFEIMESEGEIGVAGEVEPIRVNGHDGEIQRSSGGKRASIQWADDGLGFSAIGYLNDTFTEGRFLQILESIPE